MPYRTLKKKSNSNIVYIVIISCRQILVQDQLAAFFEKRNKMFHKATFKMKNKT